MNDGGCVMKHLVKCMAVLACGFLAACGADDRSDVITVRGSGSVQAPPDAFAVVFQIEVSGEDRSIVVQQAADLLNSVNTSLPALDGLSWAQIATSELQIVPRYSGANCTGYRTQRSGCEISGYRVNIAGQFQGSPAELAGNAVSLASELGATEAVINRFFIRDTSAAEQQAMARAVASAREQADAIAASLDMRVTGVHAVVAGETADYFPDLAILESGPVRGPVAYMSHANMIEFDLAVEPIEITQNLRVQFEVENLAAASADQTAN